GNERQYFAAAWVDRDHCTLEIAQRVVGRLLQPRVDVQGDVVTGRRRGSVQHAQHTALRVGLDLLHAGVTMQLVLVAAFDAGLADLRGARVAGGVADLKLAFRDGSGVSDHVRGDLPERVAASK